MYRRISSYMMVMALCAMVMLTQGCASGLVCRTETFAHGPNNAVVAKDLLNQQWWKNRHEAVLAKIKAGDNPQLLLVGDSITHFLEGGMQGKPAVWDKYYAPRHALDIGFAGDQTQHLLWRLQNGEIDGISPKVAMVMIGTNNSNGNDFTAEQIADGIVADCRELRRRLPDTKILLLAIFPRGARPDAQREKNAKASELASKIADGKNIVYMNINDKFLTDDGTLTREIMGDLLHPSPKGQEIWAEAVMPTIDRMMKE